MSLAIWRDGPLSTRHREKAASARRRSTRLRALNSITTAITQHIGLPFSLTQDFASDSPPPLTADEARFLDRNDIEKGRYFDDTTLPITIEVIENAYATTPAVSALRTASSDRSKPAAAPTDQDTLAQPTETAVGSSDVLDQQPSDPVAHIKSQPNVAGATTEASSEDVGHVLATPRTPARIADGEARQGTQDKDGEVEKKAEKDNAGLGLQVEPPSSPSSTAGGWSATTPLPGDPSPVTSVEDDDTRKQGQPRDAQTKEEHDRLLQSQKAVARREALGSDAISPEVQLRLEQERAMKATRDAPTASQRQATDRSETIGHDTSNEAAVSSNVPATAPTVPEVSDIQSTSVKVADAVSKAEQQRHTTQEETPQRMRTRVSSGVLRQKSVSEIIQESPKNAARQTPRLAQEPSATDGLPRSSAPSHSRHRSNVSVSQDIRRDLNKTDMPPPAAPTQDSEASLPAVSGGYAALKGAAADPTRDYLEPLYRIQAQDPPNGKSLGELLHKAHKAVNTADQLACIHERQDHRLLKRIYGLQYTNHWSLRQLERCPEPPAPKTHMDFLLDEMKWMRTDFRQERKMKKATAKFLAEQCAEWVSAPSDYRQRMQVKVRAVEPLQTIAELSNTNQSATVPHSPAATNVGNGELHSNNDESPPDLEPSSKEELSPAEGNDMPETPRFATVPGSLFAAVNITDESFHLRDSDDFLKSIHDLPLYLPFDETSQPGNTLQLQRKPQPAPTVSKFSDGKIVAKVTGPVKKRSRYAYEENEYEAETYSEKRPRITESSGALPPEQTDVALFDPENKHIKDRLHANTAFRPPSEFAMPSTQFYESRYPSHWTWDDDKNLRDLAKEYCFNWSLIADEMALPSSFHGAADRRTPWECFERWVELETLPNEMRKTVYFRTWGSRIETAVRNVEARNQTQLQNHAQNPNGGQPPMRRKTQPMRVDKRRSGRYLHVVDAMRKLAKRREHQQHKQAEAQKAASMRKVQPGDVQPQIKRHTPQEFSQLRHERDVQIAQRQQRYQEQMLAQHKAAQMQRSGQSVTQQQATSNGNPQQRAPGANVSQNHSAHVPTGTNTQGNVPVQAHAHGQQSNVPTATRNGHLAVPQMGMSGNVPQAQMQTNMRGSSSSGQGNNASETMQRMAMQAQFKNPQMANQQYAMQQQQPHLSPGGAHGPNGMINSQVPNNNQAMMAAMQAGSNNVNGNHTPQMQHSQPHPMNANPTASASPHMPPPPTPTSQPQQLSSGHVPAINQIKHSLQAQNPQASPAQIDQMASEHMKRQIQSQQARQNALNAASGSHTIIPGNNNGNNFNQNHAAFQQNAINSQSHANYGQNQPNMNGNNSSPQAHQQYSQLMRQRLMQQQAQLATPQNAAPNGSPHMQQPSPSTMHVSPNMQAAVPNVSAMNMNSNQQRPSSRSATPQMVRIPSSNGLTSPGPGMQQGSPRAGAVRPS